MKFSILNDKTFEMETDRSSKDNPDVYYHDKYRFLPTVVLTNESSNPVTVIDVNGLMIVMMKKQVLFKQDFM